tara:strand:- start:1543 stop:2202 length:660 start_codon:yes stop_codon:yes gene_type:complete
MSARKFPQVGSDWSRWAHNFTDYMSRTFSQLAYKIGGAAAAENGVILYDNVNGYPVVSKDGVWRQITLADGYALLNKATTITPALADTAYKIQFDPILVGGGVSLDDTFPTRIVFEEGGTYLLGFSAQITSSNASSVEFRFWPVINGTDVVGTTIVASLKNNGDTTVVSRTSIFQMTAGDYLEVDWATTSTASYLDAHAATAYAPASPSATLSISRLRA